MSALLRSNRNQLSKGSKTGPDQVARALFALDCLSCKGINLVSEQSERISSTLLEPIETTVRQAPSNTLRQHLTRNNPAEIEASRHVYEILGGESPEKRIDRFDKCKSQAWFVRNSETGLVKVVSSSCKLRWCPLCANAKKYHLAEQVSEWLESVDKPKFLTLTLKHSTNCLSDQIDQLYKSFRKLRLFKEYKKLIHGGVWFFQIKKSKHDDLWHPHLHCVIDAKYIDHTKLWKTWLTITHTSKVVDIRSVKDEAQVAEYVARYAARPSDLAELQLGDQLELVTSLHGRRLCGTWGTARVVSLTPSKPQDSDDWKNIGSWWMVATMFDTDKRANHIWKAFQTNKPLDIADSLNDFEKDWCDKRFKQEMKKRPAFQKSFEFT